jgi:hypothetical protein
MMVWIKKPTVAGFAFAAFSLFFAVRSINAHVEYSDLGIDPSRASVDDLIRTTRARATQWHEDAVLYSINVEPVRADGSVVLTYAYPGDTSSDYHVLTTLSYASPSDRGTTIDFDFRPLGLYTSTTNHKDSAIGADPPFAPDCTVARLAGKLATEGLADPNTVSISSGSSSRVWIVGDGSGHAAFSGRFSISSCERLGPSNPAAGPSSASP